MIVLYLVLPLALLLAAVAVWGFMHAIREGQYDDLDTPPLRMIYEGDERAPL